MEGINPESQTQTEQWQEVPPRQVLPEAPPPTVVRSAFHPVVIMKPVKEKAFKRLKEHIRHVRDCFDHPGMPYHDVNEPAENKFNRWYWHNLPALRQLHHDPSFLKIASKVFGQPVKPSYAFLSMYGPEGVCPKHSDRPQCQFTIDLVISQNGTKPWPLYIGDTCYLIVEGDAVAYSGTGSEHYRKPMSEETDATKYDLAFFHFVPTTWEGNLN